MFLHIVPHQKVLNVNFHLGNFPGRERYETAETCPSSFFVGFREEHKVELQPYQLFLPYSSCEGRYFNK